MKLGDIVTGITPNGHECTGEVMAINLNTAVVEPENKRRELIMLKEEIKRNKAEKPTLIADARKAKGLSQAELGKMVWLSNPMVSMHERGKAWPNDEQIERYAKVLGIKESELIAERDRIRVAPLGKVGITINPGKAPSKKPAVEKEVTPKQEGHSVTPKQEKEYANKADMVNQPNHYIGEYGLEVEDVLRNFIPRYTDPYVGHRIASAIEYLLRSPLKNGQQDIEKARKNLDQALGYMEEKEE